MMTPTGRNWNSQPALGAQRAEGPGVPTGACFGNEAHIEQEAHCEKQRIRFSHVGLELHWRLWLRVWSPRASSLGSNTDELLSLQLCGLSRLAAVGRADTPYPLSLLVGHSGSQAYSSLSSLEDGGPSCRFVKMSFLREEEIHAPNEPVSGQQWKGHLELRVDRTDSNPHQSHSEKPSVVVHSAVCEIVVLSTI